MFTKNEWESKVSLPYLKFYYLPYVSHAKKINRNLYFSGLKERQNKGTQVKMLETQYDVSIRFCSVKNCNEKIVHISMEG